jgi:hypothetical protein
MGRGPATSQGRLNAALLYGGPAFALSHQTGAWVRRFVKAEPRTIHISYPGERANQRDLRVHRTGEVSAELVNGLRVTSPARTLRDLAAVAARQQRAAPSAGRPSSRARSHVLPPEERFLVLIDDTGIPLPQVNAFVEGLMVDCVWRSGRLVVELDGHATHDRSAAIEADRRREMKLRRAGYRVLRYTWQQVTREGELIVAEIRAELRLEAA